MVHIPGAPGEVVLGGGAVGIAPEALLRFTGAPWAVVGAAEASFPAFLAAMEAGGDPGAVPGVAAWRDGRFRGAERPEAPRPGEPPDLDRWISAGPYSRRLGAYPLQTKRGCPHSCVYCTYPRLEGTAYRLRDPHAVNRGVRAMNHLATAPFNEGGFLQRYTSESGRWSEQDPVSQGQAMENFARAILAAREKSDI